MELAKNQEHTVTIEGYGEGGMGVARIDGRVVFVHGALRGEKCRVLILKTLKSVAFAKVLEVLEPSSERITPDCPYFPRCGGCTYRHIRYEEELRLKKQRVQDNLSRIGGSDVIVEEILGAQDTLRYRNKAQYPVSKDGAVGFYRARTHEVIECEHCLLVKPEADAAAEALREYMRRCRVAGYDEKTGRGLVRHLYIRSDAAGESLVCVLVNGDKLPKEDRLVTLLRDACPKCTGIVLGTNTKKGNVILGDRYRTLWGSDRLEDTLCGKTFRLSVPSFYQVNRVQAERLYAKAIEFAGLTGQETVLDLYCGASPIMSDDQSEVEEITTICGGLNINIGTLNKRTIESMFLAGKRANALSHPVVLDPVGAGASKLRTETAQKLLEEVKFTVIRGNISEVKTLASGSGTTKGVDADVADKVSEENLDSAVAFAKAFAEKTGAVIAITGAIDIVADGKKAYCIRNGHPMMSSITGTGCQLSAMTAAYVTANPEHPLEAAAAAVCAMGLAGEIAHARLSAQDGNSTYRNYIIDAIYNMTPEQLEEGAKYEVR